ncbi:3-deoxy-7-phosphoheptulonate synthase [Crossiella sp. CA198]|uniref:3-deoxy-7-phosphoheptulonate synthase n=1 Tax=Crossiella sp. CA198 TaxID=3455607 RepID=UPI003F8D314F
MTNCLALTRRGLDEPALTRLLDRVHALGARAACRALADRHLLVAWPESGTRLATALAALSEVETVLAEGHVLPLASRDFQPTDSSVTVGGVILGGPATVTIAGPCSAEHPDVLVETARSVRAAGAAMFRVGVFKPRTSPYSFQGLGAAGLAALAEVRAEIGMPIVSEILTVADLDAMSEVVDVLQVGARNMHNFALLAALGRAGKPVLLKRGMAATVTEWLHAAEYLLAHGNDQVVLCERGIRTFEQSTRFTLDLNAIPVLRERTHLPIIVDPSHGTGHVRYVPAMARAGLAAGADGVIVEVHPRPAEALSDGPQSLDLDAFAALSAELRTIAAAMGREHQSAALPALIG